MVKPRGYSVATGVWLTLSLYGVPGCSSSVSDSSMDEASEDGTQTGTTATSTTAPASGIGAAKAKSERPRGKK